MTCPALSQATSTSTSSGTSTATLSNQVNAGNSMSASHSASLSTAAAYGNAQQVNIYTGSGTIADPNGSASPTDPSGAASPSDPSGATPAADPPVLGSPGDPYSAQTYSHISGTQTLRNTPDAVAPSVYAGTNPCAVGGSAAGAGPGIGISFGITTSSHECVQRAWYVLMMQSAAAAGKAGDTMLATEDIQWARNIACNQISDEAPAGVCVPIHGKVAEQATYRTVSKVPLPTRTVPIATPVPAAAAMRRSNQQVVVEPMHPTRVAQRTDPAWCKQAMITNDTTEPDVLYIHKMCGPDVTDTRSQ